MKARTSEIRPSAGGGWEYINLDAGTLRGPWPTPEEAEQQRDAERCEGFGEAREATLMADWPCPACKYVGRPQAGMWYDGKGVRCPGCGYTAIMCDIQ